MKDFRSQFSTPTLHWRYAAHTIIAVHGGETLVLKSPSLTPTAVLPKGLKQVVMIFQDRDGVVSAKVVDLRQSYFKKTKTNETAR